MDVDELHRLAIWFEGQIPETNRRYRELLAPLTHNANQNDKQALEGPLQGLIDHLSGQRFEDLSIQQLKLLTAMGVDAYLGQVGAAFVNDVVRTSNYDPATAVAKITEAIDRLDRASSSMAAYAQSVGNLGFKLRDIDPEDDRIIIRVGFQNEVAINNVADWKDSGKEWYEIIRGLALACNEKPEDVKVVGASTGSIILILAGTVGFTLLLAKISKNITSVAMDIIGVRSAMEDLRQKGILSKVMESEFQALEKQKRDGAVTTIEGVLTDQLKGLDAEVKTGLVKSIQKLLTFNEKGGSVDFVAPEEEADDENDLGDDALKAALIEAREEIRQYQDQLHTLKLLPSKGPDGPAV